jgi:hypothetical protein
MVEGTTIAVRFDIKEGINKFLIKGFITYEYIFTKNIPK